MKAKNVLGFAVIIAYCLMASGCFSIEQEIFLNADGSGELIVFISLPDLPEKMGGAELTAKKSPADALGDRRRRLGPLASRLGEAGVPGRGGERQNLLDVVH